MNLLSKNKLFINPFKRIRELEKENLYLSSMNWVLKDSQLRTYDGLAMKADKYNILLEATEAHIKYIKIMDHYSIIKESLDRLNEVINELKHSG